LGGGVDAFFGDAAGLFGGVGGGGGGGGFGGGAGGAGGFLDGLAGGFDHSDLTWRSAPMATSPTGEAISATARPASSLVEAICCEADATVPDRGQQRDQRDDRDQTRAGARGRARVLDAGRRELVRRRDQARSRGLELRVQLQDLVAVEPA
jgi:hypothetical protein